jgi:thiol-disulfide isomerase/thioredoxin
MKIGFLALALLCLAPAVVAQNLAGVWDAAINFDGVEIPFRIGFSGDGTKVQGWFFNGDDKVLSTSGHFDRGALVLKFAHYATRLEATLKDGTLEGQYGPVLKKFYSIRATPSIKPAESSTAAPVIDGLWEIAVQSPKGESAWRLIVRQSGSDVSAAILRVDGDTGALTGRYRDGKFVLSHFSGARPSLLILTPAVDGTLAVSLTSLHGHSDLTASRPEAARAKGLAEPTDPSRHTSVQDPAVPFAFRFPDLNGKLVSNTDSRFEGKVVVVNVLGSWCPNCHDEAPFLAELYHQYRNQGLEVVALAFEEGEQLKDPARLRAFIQQYGIEYTVLLAGEPSELNAKLPQGVNLNSWPTTFFLGRDGRVRAVHAGFPGPASGDLHRQAIEEFQSVVQRLLTESVRSSR